MMQTSLPENLASRLEFAVGIMLVGLGLHVLYRLHRDRVHFHSHRHGSGAAHVHAHNHRTEAVPHQASSHDHRH